MPSTEYSAPLERITSQLLASRPKAVTYTQIETILESAGFDLYADETLYAEIIERLEARNVLVVDMFDQPSADEDTMAQSIADEVVAELNTLKYQLNEYHHPLLSASQERRLLEIVADGQRARTELQSAACSPAQRSALDRRINAGEEALDQLLRCNLRLIVNIAYPISRYSRHLSLDDLIQEGRVGFITAVERYDFNRGARLSTYATWWIRQAITRAYANLDRTIRLPVHIISTMSHIHRTSAKLRSENGCEPTDEQIAASAGLTVKKLRSIQRVLAETPVSLDRPVGDDDTPLMSYVKNTTPSAEHEAFHNLNAELVRSVLDLLTERERRVMFLRYGLIDGEIWTLEEIGRDFGVTRERIRQIEVKALRKLKHPRFKRAIGE
ncbi:MAG TPA: sigma-70 family RNA polymerase sigma factor [Herpetosiphonaceae bacterium]